MVSEESRWNSPAQVPDKLDDMTVYIVKCLGEPNSSAQVPDKLGDMIRYVVECLGEANPFA